MPNIEELLRQAMAEGKFDNLPGKGKPLQLDEENPHADPAWELAYKILKDAGYSLPWIETLREIELDIESTRMELKQAWEWYQATSDAAIDWQQAQQAFRGKISALNQRIRNYNLDVPNARFQRPVLVFEQELHKATAV
jgi:DnaJ family protein C protein 28